MKTSDGVEKMTEAALDAELRKFGIDPDALLSSTFNKVCAKLKDKSAALARAEEQNRKLREALNYLRNWVKAHRSRVGPRGK